MKNRSTCCSLVGIVCLLALSGCGVGGSDALESRRETPLKEPVRSRFVASEFLPDETRQKAAAASGESADSTRAGTTEYVPPYLDRKNPFEFARGVSLKGLSGENNGKAELRLYGFIEFDVAKAVLNIAGETRTLSAGQSWKGVDVLEVKPPEVKVRIVGVVRTISLTHPEGSSDATGRETR